MYDEFFADRAETIEKARRSLGQGLRLDDPRLILAGLEQTRALWAKTPSELPQSLVNQVEALKQALSTTTFEEAMASQADAAKTRDAVRLLQEALRQGKPGDISKAAQAMRELYGQDEADVGGLARMTGIELMSYVTQHPPFATRPNKIVPWLTNWTAVITTTYLGINFFASTFLPNIDWTATLTEASVKTAIFLGLTYGGQKALIWGWDKSIGPRTKAYNAYNAAKAFVAARLAQDPGKASDPRQGAGAGGAQNPPAGPAESLSAVRQVTFLRGRPTDAADGADGAAGAFASARPPELQCGGFFTAVAQ
jgi:cation transport regulator ChaB